MMTSGASAIAPDRGAEPSRDSAPHPTTDGPDLAALIREREHVRDWWSAKRRRRRKPALPVDPDAAQHRADLEEAISRRRTCHD